MFRAFSLLVGNGCGGRLCVRVGSHTSLRSTVNMRHGLRNPANTCHTPPISTTVDAHHIYPKVMYEYTAWLVDFSCFINAQKLQISRSG